MAFGFSCGLHIKELASSACIAQQAFPRL